MTAELRRQSFVLLLMLGALVAGAEDASAQCAMCRRALASPEGQQLVAAFRAGILLLLAAPAASFGAVAFFAVRRLRRRERRAP
jgi:hypothetical protein